MGTLCSCSLARLLFFQRRQTPPLAETGPTPHTMRHLQLLLLLFALSAVLGVAENAADSMSSNDSEKKCEAQNADLLAQNAALKDQNTLKYAQNADLLAQNAALKAQVTALKASKSLSESKNELGEWDQDDATTRRRRRSTVSSSSSTPQNAAKCDTTKDDQTMVEGTLDCGEKGDKCPDNMSKGCFVMCEPEQGSLEKTGFHGEKAINRQTQSSAATSGVCKGVITKGVVMHPNLSGKNIGLLALKRIKCAGGTCSSFKTAICIRSDKDHFAHPSELEATDDELREFALYVRDNAWENAGQSNAKLKTSPHDWNCQSNEDKGAAASFVAAF